MNRNLITAAFLAGSLSLTSCATVFPTGHTTGLLVKTVDDGGTDTYVEGEPLVLEGLERGESTQYSFLGLFSWGDSSLDAAAKQGQLRDVRYMDRCVRSFLGIFASYTTVVLGSPQAEEGSTGLWGAQ